MCSVHVQPPLVYGIWIMCNLVVFCIYQIYIYIFWYLVYNRFSINSVAPQSMLVLVNCMTQSRPASALLVTSVLHGSSSLSSHNRKPAEGRRHTWDWLDGGHQKSDLIIKESQKHMWDWLEANQGQISFSSDDLTLIIIESRGEEQMWDWPKTGLVLRESLAMISLLLPVLILGASLSLLIILLVITNLYISLGYSYTPIPCIPYILLFPIYTSSQQWALFSRMFSCARWS